MLPLFPLVLFRKHYEHNVIEEVLLVVIACVVYLGFLGIFEKFFPNEPDKVKKTIAFILAGIVEIILLSAGFGSRTVRWL